MKKVLKTFLIVFAIFLLTACNNSNNSNNSNNNDAVNFKNEYESLNGVTNANGLEHRTVNILENNPFIYATTLEIVEKIENGETFYIYFGDTQCPWCRSVIQKAIEVANKYDIKQIYYVKIWDDEHNEILRDKYELDSSGNLSKVSSGDDNYKTLLKYLDNVLKDYTLTDDNGNTVYVGEKRIYAPNFIYIKNGKPIKLAEGISEKQTDSRSELTDEILKDEEKQFSDFFSN